MPAQRIAKVALPVPLRRQFDFQIPDRIPRAPAGTRVRVPFGNRRLIGIVMAETDTTVVPAERLRQIIDVLDTAPIYTRTLMGWLKWIAGYYHHPIGEVMHTALPVALRKGLSLDPKLQKSYRLTPQALSNHPNLSRAPLQQRIWQALQGAPALSPSDLQALSQSWPRAIRAMMDKGWVEAVRAGAGDPVPAPQDGPTLNTQQTVATADISRALGSYQCFVLFGVTGSGKTEVYLQLARQVVARGQQVLVLVPEIGLTPQLVERFKQRIGGRLAVLHSELSTGDRHRGWAAARSGEADIVLGTRSAVFTPLKNPGLIVIDEEHDLSLKQQEGLRYHARDIAVLRAKQESLPIVLGSATPSLESMANVAQSRYKLIRLGQRALGAELPRVDYIDLKKTPFEHGFSRNLIEAVGRRLDAGEQSLIFINRRGYAPVLYCHVCGWQALCDRCDTRLVYHKSVHQLRCHHCGLDRPAPSCCPQCGADSLLPLGEGTQRVESYLKQVFAGALVVRIDRDSTRRKGVLEQRLEQAASGEADILVGTQLLAKGHHFPMVTLVGVVDADQGLYSVDFRATEHLIQQILQVAGRAGRAGNPGQVLIQTVHPDHPHFARLWDHDYAGFADMALQERARAHCPPFRHFALLRAESTRQGGGLTFLCHAQKTAAALTGGRQSEVQVMEPVPSPMERRAGRYRAQLLISANRRRALHNLLDELIPALEGHETARRVRWSLDVDPMEMY